MPDFIDILFFDRIIGALNVPTGNVAGVLVGRDLSVGITGNMVQELSCVHHPVALTFLCFPAILNSLTPPMPGKQQNQSGNKGDIPCWCQERSLILHSRLDQWY